MQHTLLAVALLLTLSACSYNQAPVVNLDGKNQLKYEDDFKACQNYTAQVDKGEAAKAGALVGTAAGAGIGAGATDSQAYALRECLTKKGYEVYDHRK